MAKDTEKFNGNGKSVKHLSVPIGWVWVIIVAAVSLAVTVLGLYADAKACGTRANTRLDSYERRLERMENKLDRIIMEVKK